MNRWATLLLFSLVAAALCVLPNGVRAQGTTASITGTVIEEETGEPVPGVNIVAIHEPSGTRYGTATRSGGNYSILGMRTGGPYTVRASFVGFQTVEETGIQLELNEKQQINFQLRQRTEEMEEVEVIAQQTSNVISKSRTGAATNVSQEQIDELPTISRSIGDFARLVPQSGGSGSLLGANDRYNTIQIDGATLDDTFGLGDAVPGSQAGAEPISLDAIEEFNVDLAPYDVRSSGFTGGQVNAITKSGDNQYEGTFRFRRGTEGTTGDLDGVGTGEFDQNLFVGTLSGPIIEDKLFFFLNGEIKREDSPLDTRVGTDIGSEDVFDEPTGTLEEIQSIFQNTYGFNPGGIAPISQEQEDEKLLAKLDWNINSDHRLTLRHNFVNARDGQGIGRGEDSFGFSNREYTFRSTQNSTTAQLNSTFGNNMFNEALFVYTRIRDERDVEDAPFPEMEISLGSENSVFAGIDRFSQANRLDQDLFEFTNDFTYITGDHTLTFGTNNKLFQFDNLFIQDFFGSYQFEAFETPGGTEVSAAEALRRGQPTSYQFSFATEAAGTDRPEASFKALQFAGYVQDEWEPTSALRLTLGLRVDVPVIPDNPTFNPTAFEAFGERTSDVASGNPLFAPRLGFNYEDDLLIDDRSTQIRGGVGVFSGDVPFVWVSNQFTNTGADVSRIDADFSPGQDFYGDGAPAEGRRFVPTNIGENPTAQPLPRQAAFCQENPSSSRCSDLLSPVETTEINLIAEDFDYPQTFRTNIAIDQELPYGFVGTLEGIYSNTLDDVTFRNINVQAPEQGAAGDGAFPIQESKFGRPFYGTPGAGFGGTPNRVSENFTNAIVIDNTSKGFTYNFTAELQRNVREGWGGSVAYTYNRAKNVNNATSSRAISNWQFNENKDINDPRLGTADFELRHRVLGTVNYTVNYAERFGTTLGMVYEGQSGEPFSWIYFGNANGDTEPFNDLVYVPETRDEIILESQNWELMDAFIESEDALDEARGSVIKRNTATAPWQHILDVRLAQTFETFSGQNLKLTVDIENFLNLLNDDWGRQEFTSFNNRTAWNFEGYVTPQDVGTTENGRVLTEDDVGKPRVTFEEDTAREKLRGEGFETSNIFSRWRARVGILYTF